MKKGACLILTAALALAASGCTDAEPQKTGVNVYYINSANNGLQYECSGLEAVYSPETVETLIDELQEPSSLSDGDMSSVIQGGLKINSYKYDDSARVLGIDIAGDYGSLANTGKLLLEAGLTLTFEQIDGIDDVYITIQGKPLLDANGQDIGALRTDDFVIHSGNEINIYTSMSMKLYFLNSQGEPTPETRTVYFNSNVPLEQVVVDEIIKGPQNAENHAAVPNTLSCLSVTVQEGVCYVNFDEGAVQAMATYDSHVALETIVKSLNSVCKVGKVQFLINGDTLAEFSDGTSISHIYEA